MLTVSQRNGDPFSPAACVGSREEGERMDGNENGRPMATSTGNLLEDLPRALAASGQPDHTGGTHRLARGSYRRSDRGLTRSAHFRLELTGRNAVNYNRVPPRAGEGAADKVQQHPARC
ncbi:MAG: hypothetical protein ABT940_03710 [Alphaproteobacteria bacterium]